MVWSQIDTLTLDPYFDHNLCYKYKSANATNPRGGYQKPSTQIPDHREGHYVKPNKVDFKYPNFKKNVNPNAYVKVFNFVVKANAKTFEEYIINAFNIKRYNIKLVL